MAGEPMRKAEIIGSSEEGIRASVFRLADTRGHLHAWRFMLQLADEVARRFHGKPG